MSSIGMRNPINLMEKILYLSAITLEQAVFVQHKENFQSYKNIFLSVESKKKTIILVHSQDALFCIHNIVFIYHFCTKKINWFFQMLFRLIQSYVKIQRLL